LPSTNSPTTATNRYELEPDDELFNHDREQQRPDDRGNIAYAGNHGLEEPELDAYDKLTLNGETWPAIFVVQGEAIPDGEVSYVLIWRSPRDVELINPSTGNVYRNRDGCRNMEDCPLFSIGAIFNNEYYYANVQAEVSPVHFRFSWDIHASGVWEPLFTEEVRGGGKEAGGGLVGGLAGCFGSVYVAAATTAFSSQPQSAALRLDALPPPHRPAASRLPLPRLSPLPKVP
jgi:hypothetical protein